jgi:rhamnulokinase
MAPDGRWAREVIDGFSLPDIFPKLVEPGTVLGPLLGRVAKATGLADVPVVATCGHDTAAVVASVPATGTNWAFLSCGTWSIVGKTCEKPIATPQCLKKGFSNEYTLGGWYTCRNVLGLWLVQELKRKWDVQTDPWDFDRMAAEAGKAESTAIINVADETLLAPVDMEQALLDLAEKLGQPKCQSRGQLVRCVLESLALEYAWRLEMLAELSGEATDTLFMVGGGTKNRLLCQLTANACQIPVQAGVDQCTSVGNGLTQAVALGTVSGPDEVRTIMRNSFELTTYHPEDTKTWTEKLNRYKQLQ